jgi:serine/threonine protein kinase
MQSLQDHIEEASRTSGQTSVVPESVSGGESLTGGVGTTFYRAPEQEGRLLKHKHGDSSSYTVQADIFSFGIILFEVFYQPFSTYMERAETLTILRGDHPSDTRQSVNVTLATDKELKEIAQQRLPAKFISSVSSNAQRCVVYIRFY